MGSATQSNYLNNALLEHVLEGTTYPSPSANLYIALMTTLPALDGTGGVEVSTTNTNYARAQISAWTNVGTAFQNTNSIVFNTPTPPGSGGVNWGDVLGIAVYDSLTSGGSNNLLFIASQSPSVAVNAGDGAPKILAGQLVIDRAVCP